MEATLGGETLFEQPTDLPFPIPDAERILGIEEREETAPEGHVRGVVIVEYVSRNGSIRKTIRPFFVCTMGGERVFSRNGKDTLCPSCKTKQLISTITKWTAIAAGVGILVYVFLPYLIAGFLIIGGYLANKASKRQESQ